MDEQPIARSGGVPGRPASAPAADFPPFQEVFQVPELVDDLERTMSVARFLDLLAGVAVSGRALRDASCAAFRARNGLAHDSQDRVDEARIAALNAEIRASLMAHRWEGAALGFAEYVADFFDQFPLLARVDIAGLDAPGIDPGLRRLLAYLADLGLFEGEPRRIVEFCASNEIFGVIAAQCGHRVINTDIGRAGKSEAAYGYGAKVFLRTACFGTTTANYTLDRRSLASACARRWFDGGVDVVAIHGTHIPVGERAGDAFDDAVVERSISDVVRYLEPVLSLLAPTRGMLSLRHVNLFRGFDAAQREHLFDRLRDALTERVGVVPRLCGTEPVPPPWEVPGELFTFGLVMQCG